MEWTKIKPKHFLFTDFTLNEHGALARILCLTAHLERTPTHQEMVKVTHYKSLIALQERLNSHSIDLQYIVNKVLEDSLNIEHKRAVSRETTKRYREKQREGDVSLDTTDKIRLDKIRVDKNIVGEKKEKTTVFRKPNLEQVKAYCKEIDSKIDPELFFNHYESQDWEKANGCKVKNWKLTIKTWEKRKKVAESNKPVNKRGFEEYKDPDWMKK